MGVKIINRRYVNQFYQPTNETDWLLGNVGDWQKLEIDFEVSVDFIASTQESVSLDNTNKIIKLNNGKSWSDYGFDIGDSVKMEFKRDVVDGDGNVSTSSHVSTLTIVNLYSDTLEHNTTFTAPWFLSLNIIPTDRGNEKIYDLKFKTVKQAEGLKFRYAHLSNDDYQSDNLVSFIDGSITEFSFAGLNNLINNIDVPINPDGVQSGMAIDSGTVRKISYNGATGVGTYRIAIIFMFASIFEQPSNLADVVPPSILFNAGSLTDNFEIEVFPEWNNPNTSIKNNLDHTERLGNTGWFNENFNGLDNNFNIESFNYYDDSGNAINQLDYANPVNVEVIIGGINNLNEQSEFGLGFAWIPQNEEDYHNKNTPYHQNLYINTARKYTDGINDSFNLDESTGTNVFLGNSTTNARMNIQATNNVLFGIAGADKVRLRARFIPNADFTADFEAKGESDRKYALWVSVADQDLQINFSDRVSLLLDYKDLVKVIPPAGPYPGMTNKFIEHPQSENVAGVDKYFGFVEDDVLSRVAFKINTDDNKVFRSMSFGYEVVNEDTGLSYELERYNVNLSSFPNDSNGVQNFNIDEQRGFKLEDGNNKNWVKILRDDSNDNGTDKSYLAFFATKIRWEDWIGRDSVPTEYFDINNLNNGYNNDWLDYLRTMGNYVINFYVLTEVIDDGEYKLHKNSFEITFNDYDENLNIETTHQYFRDSDDTLLNVGVDPESGKPLGVLLNNEPTRIEITYTNLTEDFDIDKTYCTTTIEVDKGAGRFEHRQLSSVWGSENDNILIPLPSETKLKVELIAPNVIKTTCLVDNNRLVDALRYKVSGRIGCFPEGNGNNQTQNGKYEARYEAKYE